MTALCLRSLNARLTAAYMATAFMSVDGQSYPACSPGNTFTRMRDEFQAGWKGTAGDPYVDMWESIQKFYKSQGWDKLCDQELLDLRQAAMAIGFTTKAGKKVEATAIHKAIKLWANRGWFRYEPRRATRRRFARRGGLIALACVGVPFVSDIQA